MAHRLREDDVTLPMRDAFEWLEKRGGNGAITKTIFLGKRMKDWSVLAEGEIAPVSTDTWDALTNRGYCAIVNGRMTIVKSVKVAKKKPTPEERRKAKAEYARNYQEKLKRLREGE